MSSLIELIIMIETYVEVEFDKAEEKADDDNRSMQGFCPLQSLLQVLTARSFASGDRGQGT